MTDEELVHNAYTLVGQFDGFKFVFESKTEQMIEGQPIRFRRAS